MQRRSFLKLTGLTGVAALGAGYWALPSGPAPAALSIEAAQALLLQPSQQPLVSHAGWSPAEVFNHCAQSIDFSLDGYPQLKPAWFRSSVGPAAFAAPYRFAADVRDDASVERLNIVNEEAQGVWDCVKCMECAQVCPKEVNPIEKITKLHNMVFEAGVAKNNVATRHAVGFAHSIEKHGLLDEGELVRYSEGNIGVLKHVPVALKMFAKGKIVLPWNMPKADKLDEIKKLVKSSSTAKF